MVLCKNLNLLVTILKFFAKSISKERFGEEYFLKLLNEEIIFDDENNEKDKNYMKYFKNTEKKREFFLTI